MTSISLHVLDAADGTPAEGLAFVLIGPDGSAAGRPQRTDDDGRASVAGPLAAGRYQLVLDTGAWFSARRRATFYAEVVIEVVIDADRHHHLPLVLAPYAYSIACMPG